MADLGTNVRYIKGIGEERAKALNKLGITMLRDLVSYFPRAYEDRRTVREIRDLVPGEMATVVAAVAQPPRLSYVRRGLDIVKVRVVDDSGSLNLTFFNQTYVQNALREGASYAFYGQTAGSKLRPEMTNPVFESVSSAGKKTMRIVPIYRLTAGVSQGVLSTAVAQGLKACDELFPDFVPESVRVKSSLAHARFAYYNIHFPKDFESLELARRRLIFEELFVLAAALRYIRDRRTVKAGLVLPGQDIAPFYNALPFALTGAQRRAIDDAVADMSSGRPMSRLVQGDVGSGKTIVAAAATYYVYKAGHQSAFMAPTEILAEQHYKTLTNLLTPLGMRVGLLTGTMTAKNKREMRSLIAQGYFHIVVGTHALLSSEVDFESLALVITDEQHRFGVDQRSALTQKGDNPHVLVMSATPIPRTLALIIYGDLDVSAIDELPPGRQPVDTFAVGDEMRTRIYNFTRKLVQEGRQAYYVCPAIEEGEETPEGIKSVREYAAELSKTVFPDLRVALLHGKQKPKEKEAVMAAFAAGETDILVSTTVIEVGVDVPNAALMVIENAERFGLSQLHQLRGRVGRGGHKSYCVLFSSHNGEDAQARMGVMCETSDGFVIAEEDLRLRGPGDFFGSRQHGLPEMKIADLSYDMAVMRKAQEEALSLMDTDPDLSQPNHKALLQRIKEIFTLNADGFN